MLPVQVNLFIEIGTEKSEIGIEYEIEMTARSGWQSETRVLEEVVAIWNILDFPKNRKSAREELKNKRTKPLLAIYHNVTVSRISDEIWKNSVPQWGIEPCSLELLTLHGVGFRFPSQLPSTGMVLKLGIGGSKGGRQGRAPPPGGPNSFIFMQFSAKIINKHTHFGSWRPPLGKILDPPLLGVSISTARPLRAPDRHHIHPACPHALWAKRSYWLSNVNSGLNLWSNLKKMLSLNSEWNPSHSRITTRPPRTPDRHHNKVILFW